MSKYRVLGLMSGSSLDGVDLALVEFDVEGEEINDWKLLGTRECAYEQAIRNDLSRAAQQSAFGLLSLNTQLGITFGRMCSEFIEETGTKPDFIASHGHTVIHAPQLGYTLQIGNPAYIASATGIPVIADFRNTDVANGGQGAPLAPIVEKHLFSGYGFYLNLGGIANLSAHRADQILAWDICACNQLLNYLAGKMGLPYDTEGENAHEGEIIPFLLEQLRSVVKLPLHQPHSLDNSFVLRSYLPLFRDAQGTTRDHLRTVTEYVARAVQDQCSDIVANYSDVKPSLMITGGSAHNTFLIDRINARLTSQEIHVEVPSEEIIDFKEGILMALCGMLRVLCRPNALASVTGASVDTANGAMYLP